MATTELVLNNYIERVRPQLDRIYKWYSKGSTDVEVAKKLGISHDSLKQYKKLYPEFMMCIGEGKSAAQGAVEQALFKTATGHHAEEKRTREIVDSKGGVTTITDKSTRYIAPDVRAQKLYLTNKDPDKWKEYKQVEVGGQLDFVVKLPEPPPDFVEAEISPDTPDPPAAQIETPATNELDGTDEDDG